MLDKNTIEEILKIKGETRGAVFHTDVKYVLDKKGEQGLEELKKKLKALGQEDIYSEEIKSTGWYPLGLRVLSLLLIKETFNWDKKEIFNMGMSAPKHSFIVKTLLRYFVSIEKTFEESAKYWEKHYTISELKAPEINLKEKRLVLHLMDFKIHPILCTYFKGYFKAITNLVVKTDKITIKETKCPFNGDAYHEFVIKWE